jgi:hypothetical protein
MANRIDQMITGLCWGIGLFLAANVLNFIGQFFHAAQLPLGH